MDVKIGNWQGKTLSLITKAYANIPPEKAAEYLGVSKGEIVSGTMIYSLTEQVLCQEGWTYNADTNLLIPGKTVSSLFELNEADDRSQGRLCGRIYGFCKTHRDCNGLEGAMICLEVHSEGYHVTIHRDHCVDYCIKISEALCPSLCNCDWTLT
jgi:hypothetical protein